MKKIASMVFVLMAGLMLAGCGSVSNQTVGLVGGGVAGGIIGGAVTGGSAVGVGIGAVGGALAGQQIGKHYSN